MEDKKQYSSIVTQVIDGIKHRGRNETFRFLQDPSRKHDQWSIEQICTILFTALWVFFTISEFFYGIIDKNEALLSEAFHSFFHCLGSGISFLCLWYTNDRGRYESSYPYGKRKLNVLAGFVNGLNTVFSAFFVLVKQTHFLLDEEHHSEDKNLDARSFKYESWIIPIKAFVSLSILLILKRYFLYVTLKQFKYTNIKEFYHKELKKWNSRHDNIHSFCLLAFHQGIEKLLIFVLDLLDISVDSYARNTLVTIFISILTVIVSIPLCTNTFINLVQGLSKPQAELIELLNTEAEKEFKDRVKIIEARFWQLDMSCIMGSIKIKVTDHNCIGEFRSHYDSYLKELIIETEE